MLHLIKIQDFFRMVTFIDSTHETLVSFEIISSGCNVLVPFQQLLEVLFCERVNDLRHSLSSQLSHNDSLWAWRITKSRREQGLDYREGEELSWCPSWSNNLWQGWSCELVHCSDGNATEPIWRVLASSWTPLKPQHSNPNPINSGILTSLFLPHLSSSLTDSLPSLNLLYHS